MPAHERDSGTGLACRRFHSLLPARERWAHRTERTLLRSSLLAFSLSFSSTRKSTPRAFLFSLTQGIASELTQKGKKPTAPHRHTHAHTRAHSSSALAISFQLLRWLRNLYSASSRIYSVFFLAIVIFFFFFTPVFT